VKKRQFGRFWSKMGEFMPFFGRFYLKITDLNVFDDLNCQIFWGPDFAFSNLRGLRFFMQYLGSLK